MRSVNKFMVYILKAEQKQNSGNYNEIEKMFKLYNMKRTAVKSNSEEHSCTI